MTVDDIEAAEGLVDFIEACPSMFHTATTIMAELDDAGFTYLPECATWDVRPGGSYYTQRNTSSVIAFKVGEGVSAAVDDRAFGARRGHAKADPVPYHFQIAASHADSPTFKLKANAELMGPGPYVRLDTEAYGGMIDYTWFDKPLAIAGRVMVRDGSRIESRLVASDREVALIPSLAIHLQRDVNAGFAPNRAQDLCPLFSAGALEHGSFAACVADGLGVDRESILGSDLYLVNRQQPRIWGAADEFISAPKLDDLACAYTSLQAFLASSNPSTVNVYACFDNEEVGSNTKQGAMSTFLADTLSRINDRLGGTFEDYHRAVASSILVSCDNAQAVHPNHPEKYDEANRVVLNGGLVIKEAANQSYCTDAFSRAAFAAICADAGVPVQEFANKSDIPGGSTLGNLSNIQVSLHAIDVGLPQLAMHSSYETGGVSDVANSIRAFTAFYSTDVRITGAESIELA